MLMVLVVVPFWTSALVRTYGWMILLRANGPINAALQALGWIERPLKLLYNNGAVLLGLVYTLLPFMILPCFTALERMDWSTVEAARDLGATPWHAFYTVTLPLTRSGIMSGITLTFVPSMGIFYIAELLGGSKSVLLGNLIQARRWPWRCWGLPRWCSGGSGARAGRRVCSDPGRGREGKPWASGFGRCT